MSPQTKKEDEKEEEAAVHGHRLSYPDDRTLVQTDPLSMHSFRFLYWKNGSIFLKHWIHKDEEDNKRAFYSLTLGVTFFS